MSYSSFTMWGMLSLMVVGAVVGGLFHGDLIQNFRDAYPSDIAKQDALRRCAMMDAAFSKYSPSDRDNCCRSMSAAAGVLDVASGASD
jgi:hypothetical protein